MTTTTKRPRVKHSIHGWGTVREILMVFTEADGPRLRPGDVAALVSFDYQAEGCDPLTVVIDASTPATGIATLAEMIRKAL